MQTVKVLLKSDVFYERLNGEQKKIMKGTEVLLDASLNIAYYQGEHFYVTMTEYEVLYLN